MSRDAVLVESVTISGVFGSVLAGARTVSKGLGFCDEVIDWPSCDIVCFERGVES